MTVILSPARGGRAATPCVFHDCGRRVRRWGLCASHIKQLEVGGNLRPLPPVRRCSVDGCDQPHSAKGYCNGHYSQWRRFGRTGELVEFASQDGLCLFDGCVNVKNCRGLCRTHYNMHQRGEPLRPIGVASKEKNPEGRSLTRGGYVIVRVTGTPWEPMGGKNGWAFEHRVVMAQKIGRLLDRAENVHHVNGIRDDNRPENLELWSGIGSQPPGQRIEDLVKFVVDNYPDLVRAQMEARDGRK